jgi:MarR family transcriptional regulator, 2-MHQ and catechol-resistance regulon repressor
MGKNKEEKDIAEGTHVFLVVWKTYRALLARAEASIKRVKLCDSDFRVLEALLHKGPLPVNVIGHKVDLTTGSITTAIDRLEEKSLVVRKNHPDDRRIRVVELTAKGRRLIDKAYAQHQLDMEKAVRGLSHEERGVLVNLLKRLGKTSEQEPAEHDMP